MAAKEKNNNEIEYLPFEEPVVELLEKIEALKGMSDNETDLTDEVKKLTKKVDETQKEIFENLTPWQRVQVARHPKRPYTLDYIQLMTSDFVEIHGDRYFSDDKAIVAGFGTIGEQKVAILGHQKGRDVKENLLRNFGSAHPEGYRKAIRVMRLAEKFSLPIIALIDTPGAYPGIGAEERGQSEAIAKNLRDMAELTVPVIAIVIGEGGSGGALGVGVANKVAILENAYYSVISPEGCAAILWKDNAMAPQAAEALKMTSYDLLEMKIVDDVIKEPIGGAHRNPEKTAQNMQAKIEKYLKEVSKISKKDIVSHRYKKFRNIGVFEELKNSPKTKKKTTA